MSNVGDIDTVEWEILITHVKGEGTYGQPRTIAIRPEAEEILTKYLKMRNKLVAVRQPGNQALFPALRPIVMGHLIEHSSKIEETDRTGNRNKVRSQNL